MLLPTVPLGAEGSLCHCRGSLWIGFVDFAAAWARNLAGDLQDFIEVRVKAERERAPPPHPGRTDGRERDRQEDPRGEEERAEEVKGKGNSGKGVVEKGGVPQGHSRRPVYRGEAEVLDRSTGGEGELRTRRTPRRGSLPRFCHIHLEIGILENVT